MPCFIQAEPLRHDIECIRAEGLFRARRRAAVAAFLLSDPSFELTMARLTARQQEALQILCEEPTLRVAALCMCCSEATLKWHLKGARAALGVDTTLEALVTAIKRGLIDPPGTKAA